MCWHETYLNCALDAAHADDGIVGLWPAGCRVDHSPDHLILLQWQARHIKSKRNVAFPEYLLQRIKREAGKLGLNKIWPILHLYLGIYVR